MGREGKGSEAKGRDERRQGLRPCYSVMFVSFSGFAFPHPAMDDLPFGRPSSPPASVESSASAAPAAATAPASAPGLQLGRARCRHCMGRGADGLKDAVNLTWALLHHPFHAT